MGRPRTLSGLPRSPSIMGSRSWDRPARRRDAVGRSPVDAGPVLDRGQLDRATLVVKRDVELDDQVVEPDGALEVGDLLLERERPDLDATQGSQAVGPRIP